MGPKWGKPDGSQMGPMVQMEDVTHMGDLGPIWAPIFAHLGPIWVAHMVTIIMVGEFCPDGNQMGPIFFATWVVLDTHATAGTPNRGLVYLTQ